MPDIWLFAPYMLGIIPQQDEQKAGVSRNNQHLRITIFPNTDTLDL